MGIFATGGGGMEKMLAGMIGFTPDEMQKTITDFRDLIIATAETMKRIEAKLDIALASGKVIDNDDGSQRASSDGNGGGGALANIGGRSDDGAERDAA